MTRELLIFKGFTGPITQFFGKATLKTNPTYFLNTRRIMISKGLVSKGQYSKFGPVKGFQYSF